MSEKGPIDIRSVSWGTENPSKELRDFKIDSSLGRDKTVIVLAKDTNQLELDRTRAQLRHTKKFGRPISQTPRPYRQGAVFVTTLDTDSIDHRSVSAMYAALEPRGIALQDDIVAISASNHIELLEKEALGKVIKIVNNEKFARLHTLDWSPRDPAVCLSVSSGFDLLCEVDTRTEEIVWEWCAWDHGQSEHPDGRHFRLTTSTSSHYADVVVDPSESKGRGLSIYDVPHHISGARYDQDGNILLTTLHTGEIWRIDRSSGIPQRLVTGLQSPHAAHVDPVSDGNFVADTKQEAVIFFDKEWNPRLRIDLSTMPEKTADLVHYRWVQHMDYLGDSLYCIIDQMRRNLQIINPVQETRRNIDFDHNLGIQQVVPT